VITTRAFRLINIRAGRRNPGLLPQHLSAVRAAAAISGAAVTGDQLASTELSFAPSHPPQPGQYIFDVAKTAGRGSAGSVSLVLQTLSIPLAFADGASSLVLRGGTHVEWSPPFDGLVTCYFPALRRMGLSIDAELKRFGWYPLGCGEIVCEIAGRAAEPPMPIAMTQRGPLRRISGRAITANLPYHIPQRMADRAQASLGDLHVPVEIEPQLVSAACPGAGIFLLAEYQDWPASFSAYGRLGKPSEAVADQAVAALREHHGSQAAVELHLADQLLLPLSIAAGASTFTTPRPSGHLMTNAWTIGQFGVADIPINGGLPCEVHITPQVWRRSRHK
jgi:RNA 3'-terminal phosphate cyclase (ATP)